MEMAVGGRPAGGSGGWLAMADDDQWWMALWGDSDVLVLLL